MVKKQAKSHRKSYLPVLSGVLILTLGGNAYGLYHIQKQNERRTKQDEATLIEVTQNKEQAAQYRYQVESLAAEQIKSFMSALKKRVINYQSMRKALNLVIQPYNFETSEYAKESYSIFTTETAPNLRNVSAQIIDFITANQALLENTSKQHPAIKSYPIYKQWQKDRDSILSKYVTYFTQEEKRLQAYEDLVKFYYRYSKLYDVDTKTNSFVFTSVKAQEREAELLEAIAAYN